MMEVSETRRLKELERENTELKKMLAEELLKNRVIRPTKCVGNWESVRRPFTCGRRSMAEWE